LSTDQLHKVLSVVQLARSELGVFAGGMIAQMSHCLVDPSFKEIHAAELPSVNQIVADGISPKVWSVVGLIRNHIITGSTQFIIFVHTRSVAKGLQDLLQLLTPLLFDHETTVRCMSTSENLPDQGLILVYPATKKSIYQRYTAK
jgi:hypothetical protein